MPSQAGDELTDLENRQEPRLVRALEMVAPGTALREGLDNILNARTGSKLGPPRGGPRIVIKQTDISIRLDGSLPGRKLWARNSVANLNRSGREPDQTRISLARIGRSVISMAACWASGK